MTVEEVVRQERPDLRLVPAAAASWGAALVLGPPAGRWPGWVLLVSMVAMAGALAALGRAGRTLAVVAVALACAAAVSAGLALRAEAVDSGPLSELATDRAVGVADLVVTSDPRPLPRRPGAFSRAQVVLGARLEALTARGRRWTTRVPVVVLGPADGWSGLLPSQHVRSDVRLAPPREGDAVSALVVANQAPRATGPPSRLQRVAGVLRGGLRDSVAALPPGERGLLPGLVVGDTSAMPEDLTASFRTAGLTHLVAVSGAKSH